MKTLGALAVIIGCGLFGLIRAMSLSRNEKCLEAVIDSLRYMISELKAEAAPLPELLSSLSAQAASGEVRDFYSKLCSVLELLGQESFESLWIGAVMSDKELALNEKQRHILSKAGCFMGKFSVGEQATALEGCIERLEWEYRNAAEKAREGKKLYPGLGVTAGLMLAAVFL